MYSLKTASNLSIQLMSSNYCEELAQSLLESDISLVSPPILIKYSPLTPGSVLSLNLSSHLMTGTKSSTIIVLEILIEKNQVTPMGSVLNFSSFTY